MFKKFSFREWLTRTRTSLYPKIDFEFHCLACRQRFKYKLRRLYVDLNTYDQRQLGPRPRRSEFVVPERVICPKCKASDQFKLASSAYHHLATIPLIANNGLPNPRIPIQCIRFKLRDGRPMHPLDGLALYAKEVAEWPEDLALRLAYANTLRMLGHHAEAEAQYRQVLERDPLEPEATLNLAVFHGKRQEKEVAVKYLFALVDSAETSQHPNHDIFAEAAQQIMDGVIQMDSIELTAPVLFDVDGVSQTSGALNAKTDQRAR